MSEPLTQKKWRVSRITNFFARAGKPKIIKKNVLKYVSSERPCRGLTALLLQEMSFFGDITEAYKSHHIINDFLFPGSSKTAYGNKISQKETVPEVIRVLVPQDGIHLSRTNSSVYLLAERTISSFLACFFVGAVRDLRKTEKRSVINMLPLC